MGEDAQVTKRWYHGMHAYQESGWTALYNRNVQRILLFSFIDGACFSLWYAQVFQVLVNRLSGDTTVGWLSATSGASQMVAALISGFIPNVPRQVILRLAAVSGLVAIALSLYGVAILEVYVFFFSSALWGVYSGITATGVEALFADSVETGRRDFVYNLKWINQTLCDCVGSLVSLVMLLRLGNHWDTDSIRKLMFTGLALHPIAHLLLFTMKDKYRLDESTNGDHVAQVDVVISDATPTAETPPAHFIAQPGTSQPAKQTAQFPPSGIPSEKSLVHDTDGGSSHITTSILTTPTAAEGEVAQREAIFFQLAAQSVRREEEYRAAQQGRSRLGQLVDSACYYAKWPWERTAVPYLVCAVDFFVAVGSGMTMRYIPLFFVHDYNVSPVVLMSTYIGVSISTAFLSYLVRYVGEYYMGRVAAVVLVRLIGTTLLLLMGLTHLHIGILLPIFIIRNSTMNSTRGVTRSVIMDCVRKESRAKWSAFESFSSFTWAGSAVVGGYIAEAKGYQFTFVVTALIHYMALLTLVPAIYGSRAVESMRRQQRWQELEKKQRLRRPASVAESLNSV
ncbi:hypothetical protein LSM04_002477 [Trypanosoma melophagium]|uniref:uncharacterized protein n=1 Tax=Trypanosoma melophagium TaxID=715481 RepID=UPI00351A04A3|nr:hypothetical protein LSM04_002477 [Trypanosoma melophagium]